MSANKLTKDAIKYLLLRGHYVVRINNAPTQRRRGTVHKGTADIMGCTKEGYALAVEIKTTDSQSEFQEDFESQYKKRKGIYIICRSIDDLIDAGL